jgi:sigma-B regulation protein RsbU (phosphoserine phosphatase)
MMRVQTILQFLVEYYTDPKKIVVELKKYFAKKLEKEYFLTLSIASIDKNGKMKYCNAGHLPLLQYKAKENAFIEINPAGIGIGFNDKGIFEKILAEEKVKIDSNDILCFYTDGITEAMNSAKVQFGKERLQSIIQENVDKSIDEIKNKILQTVVSFRGTAEVNDDISIVLLKAK